MGGSPSCLCSDGKSKGGKILVMKEDGEMIDFNKGTRVKDVVCEYPCHKIIPCQSERSVLPDSYQLFCNRLYFLVPEKLAGCDTTYESLVRAATLKGLIYAQPKESMKGGDVKMSNNKSNIKNNNNNNGSFDGQGFDKVSETDDDIFGLKKSTWKPALHAIPEVISPSLPAK